MGVTCRTAALWCAVGVFLCTSIFIFMASTHTAQKPLLSTGQHTLPQTNVVIGGATVLAELAVTDQEKEEGLSGRAGLAPNTGMLFVFTPPKLIGFWMKDMRFPIDIIFIDGADTISAVYPALSPDTYPQSVRPPSPARYVLEVSAGFAEAHHIAIGQKVVVE